MKPHEEKAHGALYFQETVRPAGKPHEEPTSAGLPLAGGGQLPDFSEEAIPERDPAYQLPDGTLHESKTIEYLPGAQRLALARRLEQLGMSAARAAMLANL